VHLINARGDFRHSKFQFHSRHPSSLHHYHLYVTLFMKDGMMGILIEPFQHAAADALGAMLAEVNSRPR
jgi:hypothetical protein